MPLSNRTSSSPDGSDVVAAAGCCIHCHAPLQIGDWPYCPHGRGRGGSLNSAIHTSERAVVFRNPRTGEVRIPPRADWPIHPKYLAQGYVREEIRTHQDRKDFERQTGKVMEQAHFDVNTGSAERSLLTGVSDAPPIKGLDGPSH